MSGHPLLATILAPLTVVGLIVGTSVATGAASQSSTGLGEAGGTVTLSPGARITAPVLVQNSTDPAACGESHWTQDVVFDEASGGLRDVIVTIEGVPAALAPRRPPRKLIIDNTECRFAPHVSAIRSGDTIEALNSDDVLHTVHLYGPVEFNLSLPMKHIRRSQRLDEPGLFIVKCDVHGWMQAYVRVDPHPFHAVSDSDGSFVIRGVPPGRYTLETWHEALGTSRREVTIQPDERTTVSIQYGSTE